MDTVEKLASLIRYWILASTTQAGSGHPTSSLSATDLMSVLFFKGFFHYDINQPRSINNDRLIFSKGHASPLLYALWAAAGAVTEEDLMTLRTFKSHLEGHPTPEFGFAEVATGSLGQGLSIGAGFALNAKYLDHVSHKTFVLLGDSEMMEGQNWEAAAFASYYKLDNLVAIVDVNRLGQRGETMWGWNTESFKQKFEAFGWNTIVIDGHAYEEIEDAFKKMTINQNKPYAIIARTIKGKGISFLENAEHKHGKTLKPEEFKNAVLELGIVDRNIRGNLSLPKQVFIEKHTPSIPLFSVFNESFATRKAYGTGLKLLGDADSSIISLDAEVSDSTFAKTFQDAHPDRFFEMFIGEQNMVSVALGLSKQGKIPFVSTFAAFFSRAFDQIRMAQYSYANMKFVGSHAGVSIGQDGPSQMGLEDMAMFASLSRSTILYPADAYATEKLTAQAAYHAGIVYLRTTRMDTPLIYDPMEEFPIGGSKVLKRSEFDQITVVAAGITLHEALKAYDILLEDQIFIRVIDAYSVRPIDVPTLEKAYEETRAIITVEDHYSSGGLGDAVLSALSSVAVHKPIVKLSVTRIPRSGTPEELLQFEGIDAESIARQVRQLV